MGDYRASDYTNCNQPPGGGLVRLPGQLPRINLAAGRVGFGSIIHQSMTITAPRLRLSALQRFPRQ